MTNNPNQAPPIKIAIEEDSASFAKVEQRTADTFNRISALAKANDAVGQSAQRMGRSLADAFAAGATKVDDNTRSIQALRKEVQGLDSDQKKVSGGGLRVEGLRRTGGALTQLGQGEIGGAISRVGDVAQIGKEVGNLIEELGPLAPLLAGAAGAVIGLQIGLQLLDKQLEDNKRGLQSALDTQKDYYQFAAKATTDDAITRKRELENVSRFQKQAVDETENALKSLEQQTNIARDVGTKLPGVLGEPFRALTKTLDDDKKAASDTDAAIGRLTGGLQSNAFAANDAAEKEQKLADARKDRFQQDLDNQIEIQKLIEGGDKKGLEKKKANAEAELAIIQHFLEANAERVAGDDELAKTFDEMSKRADKLKNDINNLNTAIGGIHPDVIGDFLKGLKKEADRISKEVNERNSRVAAVQQKYDDDVARIEEQTLQKRADIEKKYADKQVEIARQAADAAQAALTKLQQQREDLATSLGRDEQKAERDAQAKRLDIQIAAAREETKAYRDHQRELEQIRKDAYAREIGFLLDRNFLGLYESRLQTSRDIDRSNTKFGADRQDRQETTQQQIADLQRQSARERQERLIAYQQQLADAQLAYRRELQLVQQKRVQELELARQTEQAALREASQAAVNELRIRKNTYDRELRLAALYGAARVKAEDQIQQALVNRAEQRLALINGSSGGSTGLISGGPAMLRRAGGGPLGAGQTALVNEPGAGRERFNGVPFPPGLGVFTALQSGTVSPAQNGPITMNVYPSPGMDETQFAHKTLDLIEKVIGKR